MKIKNKIAVIALILSILIPTSCSVKKRVYLSGYHVEWFKNKKQSNTASVNKKSQVYAEELKLSKESHVEVKKLTDGSVQENKGLLASAANQQVFQPKYFKGGSYPKKTLTLIGLEKQAKPSYNNRYKKRVEKVSANGDEPKMNGMALTGFISSMLGIVLSFFLIGIVIGIVATVFSAIGLGKINKEPTKWKGKGLAIAGLVLGIIEIVVSIAVLVLLIFLAVL
jgi:hypothetical protein